MRHTRFSLLSLAGGFLLFSLIVLTNITMEEAFDLSNPLCLMATLGEISLLVSVYYFYRLFKFKGTS